MKRRDIIELVLPPRAPRGDKANMERVRYALAHNHQQRIARTSAVSQKRHLAKGCSVCAFPLKYRPIRESRKRAKVVYPRLAEIFGVR